jgi:hypothetical protein
MRAAGSARLWIASETVSGVVLRTAAASSSVRVRLVMG